MSSFRLRHPLIVGILCLLLVSVGCNSDQPGNTESPNNPHEGNPGIDAPVFQFEETIGNNDINAVGFDLDDTLLFSSPAFDKGFQNAEPFSPDFWRIVNTSDEEESCVKPRTRELLEKHRQRGHEIYVITARERYKSEVLKTHISELFDIPRDHVFLEPNGKTERIKKLGIDLYYGDSDSDITEAHDAGITAVRILRSPESGYDKKHNPGKFGEPYVPNSAPPHSCSQSSS